MLERAAVVVAVAVLGLASGVVAQERPPTPAETPSPAGAPKPAAPSPPVPAEEPTGYAGKLLGGQPRPIDTSPDFVPIMDRWRIGLPNWNRYERPLEAPYVRGKWWDPYNQSVIKGDYPIFGQNIFMNLSAISDTLFEVRRLPTASGVSAKNPGSADVFGGGDQQFLNQNFIVSLELFKGDTAFKPRDLELRATGVFNVNFLHTQENGVVNIDVREGVSRDDTFASLQELFLEYHLGDLTPNYDFVSSRFGIQNFVSDFRGFIFSDSALGARFFGNLGSNRQQFNAAYFRTFEKDTNSGLNRLFEMRDQNIAIANYFYQDFLVPGYTVQGSFHYLHDSGDAHTDKNGFVVRPAVVGTSQTHTIDAFYFGFTGDGHIGPLNVNHAFYQVVGRDTSNPIPAKSQDINAQMAALELSMDFDWVRPKFTFFWASGDDKPLDDRSRGFDSILDNPNFAGGGFSFWVRQGIPLTTTSLELKGRNSLLPALRSSKIEGQPNYVNPGIFLFGLGADFDVTPKTKVLFEANYLRFHHTEPLSLLLFQERIREEVGWDLSLGVRWRPLLNDNIIVNLGGATFIGGDGFKDIYQSQQFVFGPNGLEKQSSQKTQILYSGFLSVTLTF
jgi:hypothetical protein